MKKIISIILFSIFIFWNTITFANNSVNNSSLVWALRVEIDQTKNELHKLSKMARKNLYKTRTWRWYIKDIDNLVKHTPTDDLETIAIKLSEMNLNDEKYLPYKDLLNYLITKTLLELKKFEELNKSA